MLDLKNPIIHNKTIEKYNLGISIMVQSIMFFMV